MNELPIEHRIFRLCALIVHFPPNGHMDQRPGIIPFVPGPPGNRNDGEDSKCSVQIQRTNWYNFELMRHRVGITRTSTPH